MVRYVRRTVSGLLLGAAAMAGAKELEPQPVMVGPQVRIGCNKGNEYSTLVTFGHRYKRKMPIHAGPDESYQVIDHLKPGMRYIICDVDYDSRGEWAPIVYTDHPDQDCDVEKMVAGLKAYAGPCRSGWMLRTVLDTENAG